MSKRKKEKKKGYSAFCPEFEVASCGDTIEEAKENLIGAVELYLESAKQSHSIMTRLLRLRSAMIVALMTDLG